MSKQKVRNRQTGGQHMLNNNRPLKKTVVAGFDKPSVTTFFIVHYFPKFTIAHYYTVINYSYMIHYGALLNEVK
jgi:hypothetical protein